MITLVDYGAGNLRSVSNTLDALGASYEITNHPGVVAAAAKLILPGVGHFGQMMRALDELCLRDVLRQRIEHGVPFLGICIGLQCLFEMSEESPESRGLGIFAGSIQKFKGPNRIPHMGWNSLQSLRPSKLLAGLTPQPYTYFAHSYFAPVVSATSVTCTYMQPYSAILEQENIYAVQFHPEKSGAVGQRVVCNFLEI